MPKFYEVYGADVYDKSKTITDLRRSAICPFTEVRCDGGGNRHQTKIKLNQSELRPYFNEEIDSIIPGICSIEYGSDVWIVCPRRLLGFSHVANTKLEINKSLKKHERESLIKIGLPLDVELGVWSEVYLQFGDDDVSINYHFDFIIAPVYKDISFEELVKIHSITDELKIEELKKSAKVGKYITGKGTKIPYLPDLSRPIIVEVMTASTSGSDQEAGTDISSSFTKAIQGFEHNCPGINKRQVWGRMATQLFAKSALAESWDGKTVWLVQDKLLENIELTTRLNLNKVPDSSNGSINFLSMSYTHNAKGLDSIFVKNYSEKESGINFSGTNTCSDILLSKVKPSKTELLKSVLRRPISALIKL
jgi:hypothetical protein